VQRFGEAARFGGTTLRGGAVLGPCTTKRRGFKPGGAGWAGAPIRGRLQGRRRGRRARAPRGRRGGPGTRAPGLLRPKHRCARTLPPGRALLSGGGGGGGGGGAGRPVGAPRSGLLQASCVRHVPPSRARAPAPPLPPPRATPHRAAPRRAEPLGAGLQVPWRAERGADPRAQRRGADRCAHAGRAHRRRAARHAGRAARAAARGACRGRRRRRP
jgi:hypothetical protein